MQTLDRTWASRSEDGRPIDVPFDDLAEIVTLRTGELVVLAGESGGGKSTVAVNWAYRTSEPVLYLAQEAPASVRQRLTALALSRFSDEVDNERGDYYSRKLAGLRPELVLERGPQTLAGLESRLLALTEWLMRTPTLVIIDNVKDILVEDHLPSTNDFYATVFPALKQMAIKYDCCIMGLHHANRGGDAETLGVSRLPLGRLLYSGDRDARHVWSVYHSFDNTEMYLSVLKQQDGEADPSGKLEVKFDWAPTRCEIHRPAR